MRNNVSKRELYSSTVFNGTSYIESQQNTVVAYASQQYILMKRIDSNLTFDILNRPYHLWNSFTSHIRLLSGYQTSRRPMHTFSVWMSKIIWVLAPKEIHHCSKLNMTSILNLLKAMLKLWFLFLRVNVEPKNNSFMFDIGNQWTCYRHTSDIRIKGPILSKTQHRSRRIDFHPITGM
jgi:hypothetical protein